MKPYDLYIIGPVTIDYDEYMGDENSLGRARAFQRIRSADLRRPDRSLAQTAPEQSYIHQMFYVQDIHHLEAPVTTNQGDLPNGKPE